MLTQQNGHPLGLNGGHGLGQRLNHDRRQALRGFVEQQHIGIAGQGACDTEHLLFAPREQAGRPAPEGSQGGKQGLEPGLAPGTGAPRHADPNVFGDRQAGEHAALLGHPAKTGAGQGVQRPAENGLAVQADVACRDSDQAQNGEEGGAFPRPVASEQGHALAGADREAEAEQNLGRSVTGLDIVNVQHPAHLFALCLRLVPKCVRADATTREGWPPQAPRFLVEISPMVPADDARAHALIESVVALVGRRLEGPPSGPACQFVRLCLAGVPPEDLMGFDAETLYGQTLSLWSFARRRTPGRPKVRAYRPSLEEHGWGCDHAVVEIVSDDRPFLVDSVVAELTRLGLGVRLLVHPVLRVTRDASGSVSDLAPLDSPSGAPESIMHLQVVAPADPARLAAAEDAVLAVLELVRLAVTDWQAMRQTCTALGETLPDEERAFLRWLADDHFTFLGALPLGGGETLGLLRAPETAPADLLGFDPARLPADGPRLLLTKSLERARVHRPVAYDVVVVRAPSESWLFLGLFTADVYTDSPREVPLLRGKITQAITVTGRAPGTHDGRKLLAILETLPRDELFQADAATLARIALGVLRVQERPRPALFLRAEPLGRFVSCLVFVPRDRHDTALRLGIQTILEEAFDGRVLAFSTQMADTPLARLHVCVQTQPGILAQVDARALEARIADAARAWTDALAEALVATHGEERGSLLASRYAQAFPAGYRERFGAPQAVADINRLEEARAPEGPRLFPDLVPGHGGCGARGPLQDLSARGTAALVGNRAVAGKPGLSGDWGNALCRKARRCPRRGPAPAVAARCVAGQCRWPTPGGRRPARRGSGLLCPPAARRGRK
ncbi:Glutamate dehydrogenase (NAD) [Pararhodospirillum photometricum DSM 122]|uniref:Glutamate dehydrogenase (NAD) n=1 Tax=Pararhodospirillum photometricum DSM 122 TaxID=1150469 RepID=H6SJ87_PARPM|nr:Glutamate dehydrogenase (NAD) [Pararhodospirillum photometricum DSM 122]